MIQQINAIEGKVYNYHLLSYDSLIKEFIKIFMTKGLLHGKSEQYKKQNCKIYYGK